MLHRHLQSLREALAAERDHQRSEHQRLASLSDAEQLAAGVAWPALTYRDSAWVRGRCVVDLGSRDGVGLHDGIGGGDRVRLRPSGGGPRWLAGFVLETDGPDVTLRLDGEPKDLDPLPRWFTEAPVSVTLRFDPSTFDRYIEGLDALAGSRLPLALALLEPTLPEDPPRPRRAGPSPLDCRLNAAQQAALEAALRAERVALIHGPPGTGKTHVIGSLLAQLVARGERPWALAESNAATDHLAVTASQRGLDVVRLGHRGRIGARAQPLSVEGRIDRGPLRPALDELDREISAAHARKDWRGLRPLWAERRRLRGQAWELAVGGAEVVASTFGTMVRQARRVGAADTAVVDEATQALEPAIWSLVPHVGRLILVGDPHQLGPVVTQPGNPLGRSLLERLVEGGYALPMLEEQHRMSSTLTRLVRRTYGPSYRAHPTVADHQLAELADRPQEEPLLQGTSALWVDTAGAGLDEERDPRTMSLFNPGEAALVAAVVGRLRKAGVPTDAIGVIAPYSAQVDRLAALPELADVEVATVNAFQGREKEAIVATWVRSNPRGELGFVADPRRLIVGLTRARRLFVGIGDTATLAADQRFAELFDDLADLEALASVWEPPWDTLLAD